jgi:hypothetical protein
MLPPILLISAATARCIETVTPSAELNLSSHDTRATAIPTPSSTQRVGIFLPVGLLSFGGEKKKGPNRSQRLRPKMDGTDQGNHLSVNP